MIDTVVLTLLENDCKRIDTSRFTNKKFVKNSNGYFNNNFFSAVQNPNKQDMLNGVYMPRLTFYSRYGIKSLRVEFSAPKMLYNNNFQELTDDDFSKLIATLQSKLYSMGVTVDQYQLINCEVSAVHYSKNIELKGFLTTYQVLKELNKVDYNHKLDVNKTDFRNNGDSLRFRTKSLEICFYDKIKDLAKAEVSESKSLEKDNYIQLGLFEELKKLPKEVLRYELRLGNRREIKKVLKNIGLEQDLKFKTLYNKNVSKKVLLYFYAIMQKGYLGILNTINEAEDFITSIMLNNSHLSLNKAMMYCGYKQALQELGIGKFRLITGNAKGSWSRIKRELQGLDLKDQTPNPLEYIKQELVNFENVNYEQKQN